MDIKNLYAGKYDNKLIRLVAMEYEGEKYIKEIDIFIDIIDRRRRLVRRNSLMVNVASQIVTSEALEKEDKYD